MLQHLKLNQSISWRLILPIPIILIAALAVAWIFLPNVIGGNARDTAVNSAVQTVGQFKTLRAYYTKNIIKKVLANGTIKPSIDHEGKENTVPLPATVIHDLSALLAQEDTRLNLYSGYPFPNRADRQLDPYQQQAWEFLSQNPDETFVREEIIGGEKVVRVAVADKLVAEGCVACHNSRPDTPKSDWQLGDVRGVLEVTTSIDGPLAAGAALSRNIMLASLLAGMLLMTTALFGARSVVSPLKLVTGVMRRLADGDNSVDVPAQDRQDEIGSMARRVEVFKQNAIEREALEKQQASQRDAEEARLRQDAERAENVTRMIEAFDESAKSTLTNVATAADQMKASADTMTATADETHQRSTAVAAASEEASTNMQTVASATEEMTSSVQEISRRVVHSAEIATSAVEQADATNQKVEGLAEAAQKIGEVVNLINDIADQTNLLALNATIEASRAGEAGKGFAVVASEVKSLAGQTAKATEEISAQIGAMQKSTEEAVAAIQEIGKTIGEISEVATTVASAVEEQDSATREIAENIQQAASGTENVSSNITEVSRGAQETGSVAQQVLEASQQLSQQAEKLRGSIGSFLDEVKTA
ncbi:MAG: DUF3365 domain-containing protein [Alphaproteobacteria bacterium]|nr:DUF3365 domain-containing protein [Alphaproteobacteria bacterium]